MIFMKPELAFGYILPEISIALSAIIVLILSVFRTKTEHGAVSGAVSLAGTVSALYFTYRSWGEQIDIFNGLYTVDSFAVFFKVLTLVITLLVILMSSVYIERENIVKNEYHSLLLFGTLGMMIMVSSSNFITIFIGLEVMSIAVYVLCGLMSGNIRSMEASLKYFLLGAFATAFLLYGIALIYSTTGFLDVRDILNYVKSGKFYNTPAFMAGIALLIVGFGFKTASVPFHMWTPDVYEGAPTSITAYMATGVKAAAFGAFLRVFFTALHPFLSQWSGILWIIAVSTMTLGNVTALMQKDIKRMLAYSSIAHAGYILIAFVIGDKVFSASVLFYLVVYAFMNIGAFSVVILLGRGDTPNTGIESYAGLASGHPLIALSMAIFLLSLAGIPPLAGFMGKFYIFSAAIKAHYYWLAIIGVLNSVVAAYYYLRVVMYMYFKEPEGEILQPDISPANVIVAAVSICALIYMGIFPRAFLLASLESIYIFR